MSLFVILMFLFTAVSGDDTTSFTVRHGEDVTLPCGNVIKDQQKCDKTSWLFSRDIRETVVELITLGIISKDAGDKAKRLSVSEDCSLVIKNVKRDDVGRYTCRQFRSGKQVGPDARVLLNVINITSSFAIKFVCQVFTYGACVHTVRWYYKGDETDKSERQNHQCAANVTFKTQVQRSNLNELFCNVTDQSGQTLLCNVNPGLPCEKTDSTNPERETSAGGEEDKEDHTPAVSGDDTASLIVRFKEDVTLPCGNVIKDQTRCDKTSWLFSRDIRETVELITDGNISKHAGAKAEKLSVTEDCSLVIKNVKRDDVGRYACRQFRSGEQVGPDVHVLLYVIDITSDDAFRFYCHVFSYRECVHTVQWYYKGDETDISEQKQYSCSAFVTFKTEVQKSKLNELLFCNVTDQSGQTLLCESISESPCEKTGSTNKNRKTSEDKENHTPESRNKNRETSEEKEDEKKDDTLEWWPYAVGAAGLAAFLIILACVVVFIRRKKTKGNKKQSKGNDGQSLNPAVTQQGPETSHEMEEPEDVVAYASVSYTKNGTSKAQADGDAEGESVTYSSVKVPSSDAGASVDPSSLYATVNKPNKNKTTG